MAPASTLMEKTKLKHGWVRGMVAALITFIYLGAITPNLMSGSELAMVIGMLLVPLACIHFGADRYRYLEFIGWVLLLALLLMVMSG